MFVVPSHRITPFSDTPNRRTPVEPAVVGLPQATNPAIALTALLQVLACARICAPSPSTANV